MLPLPQPLPPPSLDRLGRWDRKASLDATGLRVRKVLPDLRALLARRVPPASRDPRENMGVTVLRVQPDRLDLLAARRHGRWPRARPDPRVRLDPKDRRGLPARRVRKDWQDIRVPKGPKAHQVREGSRARPVLWVLQDQQALLGPRAQQGRPGEPDHKGLPVRSGLSALPAP
jgi:hypothetical protein